MKYKKELVIKRGEDAINRYKKYWLIGGIISLSIGAAGILEYIFIEAMRENVSLYQLITVLVLLFGFGVFALIFRQVYKYEPLLEGCKDIERSIKKAVNRYNKINANTAKATAKETGKEVTYSICSSEFKYRELYDLLQKSEVVTYIGYPSVVIAKIKAEKKNNSQPPSNHNFDPYLTDEEFEDMME